jgi:hypothetical protein
VKHRNLRLVDGFRAALWTIGVVAAAILFYLGVMTVLFIFFPQLAG